MLHRSIYIRRESSPGSLMQIMKNKYILPLAIKGTQGCFSFKLDNSFNSSSHQISPIHTQTFSWQKHLSPEPLIIASYRLEGVITRKENLLVVRWLLHKEYKIQALLCYCACESIAPVIVFT